MSFSTYHQPDTLKNSKKILRSTSNSSNLSQLSSNSRPGKKIKSFVKSDDRDKIVNQKIKYLSTFLDNPTTDSGKFSIHDIKFELNVLKNTKSNNIFNLYRSKKIPHFTKMYLEDGYISTIFFNKGYGFIQSYCNHKNLIFYLNKLPKDILDNIFIGKKVNFSRKITVRKSDIAVNIIDFYN